MNKRVLMLLLLVLAVPAYADFREVEKTLRAELGSPMYIPFVGVARFATWIIHPKGVHDFQFTTWEDKTTSMAGEDLERLLRRGLTPDYQPVVRARSRGEWTFVYARPVGSRFEIMVLTHDRSDTVLVRADVDAEELARTASEHRVANMR
jgi:hypothetical protein